MPHTYASLYYHIIFATKNREPVLPPDVRPRLYGYISGIVKNERAVLLTAGGTADHVHLFIRTLANVSIPDMMESIKAGASRWIHATYPSMRQFAWQRGYGIFSVDPYGKDRVCTYIGNQAEHHRTKTFQEEFEAMLRDYEVEYEQKYLFT